MVTYKYLSKPIKVDNGIYHLVLENKTLFRKTLTALIEKNGGEWFVLSENYNPIDFNKKSFFISSVLMLNYCDKKLMTKIQSDLTAKANEMFFEDLSGLRTALNEFAEKLLFEFDFDFVYDDELYTSDIIKLLGFRVRDDSETHLEQIGQMLRLLQKYSGIKLFICCNLNVYFTSEEISKLSKMVQASDLVILNIENRIFPGEVKEKTTFVDRDLCEIIDNEQ